MTLIFLHKKFMRALITGSWPVWGTGLFRVLVDGGGYLSGAVGVCVGGRWEGGGSHAGPVGRSHVGGPVGRRMGVLAGGPGRRGARGRHGREVKKGNKYLPNGGFIVVLRPQIESSYL